MARGQPVSYHLLPEVRSALDHEAPPALRGVRVATAYTAPLGAELAAQPRAAVTASPPPSPGRRRRRLFAVVPVPLGTER